MRKIRIIDVDLTVLESKKRPIYSKYRPSYKNNGELYDCEVELYTETPIEVGDTNTAKIVMDFSKKFNHSINESFYLCEGKKEVAKCKINKIHYSYVE